MTTKEKKRVKQFIEAISGGIGDHCGCNDDDEQRTKEWTKNFFSLKNGDFNEWLDDVTQAVAYGD